MLEETVVYNLFTGICPTFQYTPIDLVATCDLRAERARGLSQQYHAKAVYTDYATMLQREQLDAVFIIINYPDELPRYAEIATAAASYPIHLPPLGERRRDPAAMRDLLDHYESSDHPTGGGATIVEFKSGAVGVIYRAAGRPLSRIAWSW